MPTGGTFVVGGVEGVKVMAANAVPTTAVERSEASSAAEAVTLIAFFQVVVK
jgi:hypothetical protein